jgi:hypothetical protein
VLVDLPAPGTLPNNTTFQERSTRGWLDPENRGDNPAVSEPVVPGTFYRMHFDLQPKDMVAIAGRRLGVMIVSSDQEASIRPAPGTQLTLDLSQSRAEIPVVGGAKALAEAFGNTAPTVAYTLSPPTPTGSNGWYSGNVSLTWQVGDGGAALTRTGCADETFATDGTFTRSCTASNVVGKTGPVSVTVRRDATAPTTTATLSPTAVGAWYSPRTVTLPSSDGAVGSGVASTEYSVDGGPWKPYTGPFFVATFGPHTLLFRSTDAAGNVEATKTVSWGSDFTAAEQLDGLAAFVTSLGLDRSLTTQLLHSLDQAANKLDKQLNARGHLDAFVKRVVDAAGK